MEKENPNLITVFICFLRSGLRFTRYDTNNVGLAFIDEIKKHNPNFKPIKVQQRERDQVYTVNAYPKEFEQLIMSLIEEYRIKHKLEYRLKKPRDRKGNYNRAGGNRQGGYNQNRDQRGTGSYSRPRRDDQGGGYNKRNDGDGYLEGGYHPRRSHEEPPGQSGYRPRRNSDDNRGQGSGGYRPRRSNEDNRPGNYQPPRRDSGYNRDGYSPNRGSGDQNENKRPRRPRKDFNE